MHSETVGKVGLGTLSLALIVAGLAAIAASRTAWIIAWLMAVLGLLLSAASFHLRRREQRRLREELDALASEWE